MLLAGCQRTHNEEQCIEQHSKDRKGLTFSSLVGSCDTQQSRAVAPSDGWPAASAGASAVTVLPVLSNARSPEGSPLPADGVPGL